MDSPSWQRALTWSYKEHVLQMAICPSGGEEVWLEFEQKAARSRRLRSTVTGKVEVDRARL